MGTIASGSILYAPQLNLTLLMSLVASTLSVPNPQLNFTLFLDYIASTAQVYGILRVKIRRFGKKYILEIRDSSDNLVAVLENAFDISYIRTLNQIPQLDFSLPADDDKAANLVRANKIVLRETHSNTVIEQFRLLKLRDSRQ